MRFIGIGIECNRPYNIGLNEKIIDCFKKLFNEFLINDKFFPLASEAGLITLLTEVKRSTRSSPVPYPKTVEYIHKHYNENISAKALADMENLSYSHYYNIFKQAMGMSPHEYINVQRINNACFYLMGSTYSIAEISSMVGYDDQFYFSRIFKKRQDSHLSSTAKAKDKKCRVFAYILTIFFIVIQ